MGVDGAYWMAKANWRFVIVNNGGGGLGHRGWEKMVAVIHIVIGRSKGRG